MWPQHELAIASGAKCEQCTLANCHRGPVPSSVIPGSRLAVIGEGPGPDEVAASWNFVGWSGDRLNDCLRHCGVERSHVTVINATACQPPDQQSLDDYEKREIRRRKKNNYDTLVPTEACNDRLHTDLHLAPPVVYLAVGKIALSAVENYLRQNFLYDGDTLSMAQMHGAPVLLNSPRIAHAATILALQRIGSNPGIEQAPLVRRLYATLAMHEKAAAYHGADTQRFLFGSYHFAFAANNRSPKWMQTILSNVVRAIDVAKRGWINWAEPSYIVEPPANAAIEWLREARRQKQSIYVDLETCQRELPPHENAGKPSKDQYDCAIRTVGLGYKRVAGPDANHPVHAWSVLVLPFRHMDGSLWEYTIEERATLAEELRITFDQPDVDIITHNGIPFDSAIMLRTTESTLNIAKAYGGDKPLLSSRAKRIIDTRVLHHNTREQDMPHTLSFVTRRLYEAFNWKTKEDITSTDNANDTNLLVRCGRDVYTTGMIHAPLANAIRDADTSAQNEIDHKIGLILRDMGDLGLCVDEFERGRLSELLNRECNTLLNHWYELVGEEVNPRSVQQMQTLLFEDWGIEPPIHTDGSTYDPDKDEEAFDADEGSTSAEAILMIMDRATEHGEFGNVATREEAQRRLNALEKLLEFKALDKPRGSYTDNVPVRKWRGPMPNGRAPAQGVLYERDPISIVHATWVIPVTPVGRSACRYPGLQQIPKRGRVIVLPDGKMYRVNMRRQYVAAPGHVLVNADYEQSHVRIFYAVAQDAVGYDAIQRGLKPHHLHAAGLLAERPDLVMDVYEKLLKMSEEDQDYWKLIAKKFVFATIYNPRVLHEGSDLQAYHTNYRVMKKDRNPANGKRSFPNLKLEECKVFEERWYNSHPATEPWQISELKAYEERGYAMSPILDKRKRFGPLDKNAIGNHAILAFEGSLKNDAAIKIAERIPYRGWSEYSGLVGDFHDSLMVQVPEDRADEACQIVGESMTYYWRGMKFYAKPKVAKSWGDL